jgi:hypothetical protein
VNCQTINVLWYTYAHPSSAYRRAVQTIADAAHTFPSASGLQWKLTFFGPESRTPTFRDYNVLVIQSGEALFTAPHVAGASPTDPAKNAVMPDYRGILRNKAAIEAARGERTFISGSDADVHAMNGDTGNAAQALSPEGRPGTCAPVILGDTCWDGALGHLVNAVNWAASGRGLGIVSLVAAEYPGSAWWSDPDSFLRNELNGYVTVFWETEKKRENNPVIPAGAQSYPLNYGLTSKGLGNWKSSFHAGFSRTIPGYTAIVDSTLHPEMAVAIATARFANAGANGPP